MIGIVNAMMVSRSHDKEAYLKSAYSNVRSMALQDLSQLTLRVILSEDTIRTTGVILSCNVLNDFVKPLALTK